MPVKDVHVRNAVLLRDSMEVRLERTASDGYVYMDLAWRWDVDHRARGVDPDVMLVTPAPPHATKLKSLRAWAPGHHPPRLGVEIVSDKTARKDYVDAPLRYAAARIRELVVFDPDHHRLRGVEGPYTLQVWRRARNGRTARQYAGDGPCESEALGAWLVIVEGTLRIADDREGKRLWPTRAEAERAEAVVARVRADTAQARAESERERAQSERERAENERAQKEAAQAGTARILLRRAERRLGRALAAPERATLQRRLEAVGAETLDGELDAFNEAVLAEWLRA